MIMLQRAAEGGAWVDCEDEMVQLACAMESDECPAACREAEDNNSEEPTDTVVKSGDLDVEISRASNSSIVDHWTADMDTIKFRTSEEVTISKVTLERYGYSSNDDVKEVRLEDEDGNVIAEAKSLNSKGVVTLNMKKDYKTVDGILNATIVATTTSEAGKTIWFKVTDVDSSAKNLNLDNYTPYAYTVVVYDGATVVLSAKSTSKEYNFEAWESYEIAKFKVKAPSDWAISVKGFTLTNNGGFDEEEWLENVTVKVAGKEVSANYTLNKDKELVINFKKEVELEAKANVEVVVYSELSDDFDEYETILNFSIKATSDFNATEVKTSSRVTVEWNGTTGWPTYTFNWWKVKITNTKLGTVESPINSEDVVIAEGKVETTQEIKGNLYVTVKWEDNWNLTGTAYAIEAIRVSVNGDETEGKPVVSANDSAAEKTLGKDDYKTDVVYRFSNVEIDEDATFKILVDIRDDDNYSSKTINFTFGGFKNMVYVENKSKPVDTAGSITIYKLNIQAAKASLTNSLSKSVDYKVKEDNRHTVLEWTYTAKKWAVKLNEFYILSNNKTTDVDLTNNDVTFYLSIDGNEVADVELSKTSTTWSTYTYYFAGDTFSDIEIDAGESVKVELEAEVDAWAVTGSLGRFNLYLKWEDDNGNEAGVANKLTVELKVATAGTVNVSATTQKNTVLLRKADASIANFSVKSSNSSEVDIDTVSFVIWGLLRNTITDNDVSFKIGWTEIDAESYTVSESKYSAETLADEYYTDNDCSTEATSITAGETYYVKSSDSCTSEPLKTYYTATTIEGVVTYTEVTSITAGETYYYVSDASATTYEMVISYEPTESVSSAKTFEISLEDDEDARGTITVGGLEINGKNFSNTFKKRFESALVTIASQEDWDWSTDFVLDIETYDDEEVSNIKLYADSDTNLCLSTTTIESKEYCIVYDGSAIVTDGDDIEVTNDHSNWNSYFITAIQYVVDGDTAHPVTITKSEYNDYFKVWSSSARVFKID